MDLIKRATPDDLELRKQRAEVTRLERALAEREQALDAYQRELAAFEVRYAAAFRAQWNALDELEARLAERAAALKPEDRAKQRKAERVRARAEGMAPDLPRPKAPDLLPSDEIKATYRALSKLIHPDLAADAEDRERREAAMRSANAAYAAGDLARLTAMAGASALAAEPEASGAAEALARVERQIGGLRAQVAQVEAALAMTEATDMARLMRHTLRAASEGRDLFARLAGELEAHHQALEKRLRALDRRLARRGDPP